MFETVVPETAGKRSRKLFYESLPVSLALHAVIGAAWLAGTIWTIEFPQTSPRMYAAYQLIATPPPPPPPPPPALRRVPVVPTSVPVKMPLVAPTIIPDTIPEVTMEEPVAEVQLPPVTAEVGVQGGTEGGVEGGEVGGEVGGVTGGLPAAPPPEILEIKRDAPLPVGAIAQEFPAYPDFALRRNWEDVLVVRYLIGKDGRVKEVSILQPPEREEFAREAVNKIRHWRFHPYRDENGEPKEVAHELTVEFKIVRKGKR